jgi:4-amino-4-deoxy-L-arabinose transferase-like glycosyltransferase
MAMNPVSIFVSQKIWAEEISLVYHDLVVYPERISKAFLAERAAGGVALGIAVLMKHIAGIFLITLLIFYFYDHRKTSKSWPVGRCFCSIHLCWRFRRRF